MYTADVGERNAAGRSTRRASSAASRTSRSRGQLTTDSGRTSCCFNLRRTACLCATSQGFAGDLGGVIEDCVFSRAMVNATPIAGPSPAERSKMERYRRCRSAAAAAARPATAVLCPRTLRTRRDAFLAPQRSRRPATAVSRVTSAPSTSGHEDDTPRRQLNAVADMIPRLYRTYGYQFTSSYRPAVSQLLMSPPTSRPVGGEASDDDGATVSVVQQQGSSVMPVRRADRDRDRTSSTRSLKRDASSPVKHNQVSK